jgi:hypothetical protein
MPTETTTEAQLDAAFDGGFEDEQPENTTPAADAAAPNSPAAPEATQTDTSAEEDELASLSPRLRAMFDDVQQLKQAAQAVPGLEQRLRKTEGRIGDLNTRLPAPPPPAPPKLEKVERVRAELPEVVEAFEEYVADKLKSQQPVQPAADTETPLLAETFPQWEQTVAGDDFAKWLDTEGGDYATKVKTTTSEAVMLEALTRYDVAKKYAGRQAADATAAAQRVAQTRQSRAAAAAVPAGAGRRAPTPASTLDDAFEAGFRGT